MKHGESIAVSSVTKAYDVRTKSLRSAHPTLKDDVGYIVNRAMAAMGMMSKSNKESFLALDDVSFSIKKGDVVGLIGKNGSGKSTMLKIISQITKPTSGKVTLSHKPSSLLEVGTGFHPELSGRENVYFNGTILGMSKKQIDKKFDEIVDFSGIGKFIETPVKFYSSGMTVRLAFSVAAFLDPEILLIDEVLAVGDINFKQKSLERTQKIASSGATVLFVSHQIGQLKKICKRGIVLDGGVKVVDDTIDLAIEEYLRLNQTQTDDDNVKIAHNQHFTSIATAGAKAHIKNSVPSLTLGVQLRGSSEHSQEVYVKGVVFDPFGHVVYNFSSQNKKGGEFKVAKSSLLRIGIDFPFIPLPPGEYKIRLDIYDSAKKEILDTKDTGIGFNIKSYDYLDFVMDSFKKSEHSEILIPYQIDQKILEK